MTATTPGRLDGCWPLITPLYAGETTGRIGSIVPAAQAVRELAGA